MHLYVGVTDRSWFNFHRTRNTEEVNFWRPGESAFRALDNGDPLVEAQLFLFRLKAPVGKIAGGGMLVRYEFVRVSTAGNSWSKEVTSKELEKGNVGRVDCRHSANLERAGSCRYCQQSEIDQLMHHYVRIDGR